MELQIREFSVDLRQPLSTAKGDIERREGFLVAVDAAGTTGIGEATPLPGWTESLAECGDALNSVSDPKRALADGSLADAPAARHAVSLALADARARAANQPLATTLDTD